MLYYLVPISVEDLQQICIGEGDAVSFTCGEYTLELKEAVLKYDVDCDNQVDRNSPCRNVTSLFQNTCYGYSNCIIQWSAVECLKYRCMEQPIKSIEANFRCIESML